MHILLLASRSLSKWQTHKQQPAHHVEKDNERKMIDYINITHNSFSLKWGWEITNYVMCTWHCLAQILGKRLRPELPPQPKPLICIEPDVIKKVVKCISFLYRISLWPFWNDGCFPIVGNLWIPEKLSCFPSWFIASESTSCCRSSCTDQPNLPVFCKQSGWVLEMTCWPRCLQKMRKNSRMKGIPGSHEYSEPCTMHSSSISVQMHHMGISASLQFHPEDLLLSGQNPYDLWGAVSSKNHAHSRLPFRKWIQCLWNLAPLSRM